MFNPGQAALGLLGRARDALLVELRKALEALSGYFKPLTCRVHIDKKNENVHMI